MSSERRRAVERLVLASLLLAYVALFILLPARAIHGDALDELLCIESPSICVLPRHAAVESTLWLAYHGLLRLGYTGRALRLGQLWNGAWMTAALIGVWIFARRQGRSSVAAIGIVLALGALPVSLHLALDPFLLYWPPGLALMTWALCTPDGSRRSAFRLAGLSLALAVTNPIALVGAALAAVYWFRRGPRSSQRAAAGAASLLAVVAVAIGVEHRFGGAGGGFFGRWTPHLYGSMHRALDRFFFPPITSHHRSLLLAGQWLLTLAFLAAVAWLLRHALFGRHRWEALSWLAGALIPLVFVAWWDPQQEFFYLLPVWLVGLGALAMGRVSSVGAWPLCVVGALVALGSLRVYAFGSARSESTLAACAAEARAFFPTDVVVEPVWQDMHLIYYFHRTSIGLLTLFATRSAGQSTMTMLDGNVASIRAQGGRVFLHTMASGQPFPPPTADADWTPEDLLRRCRPPIIRVAGQSYRELRPSG